MKVVAVVQARMGSTRLPGKVVKELGGRTVLEQVLSRLSRATQIHEIVLATTILPEDATLESLARTAAVRAVRGSVTDVLSRFLLAMRASGADHVVRVTADCPCIDPDVVDRVIAEHLTSEADYTTNTRPRSFPHGLDVEVVTKEALEQAGHEATAPEEREHVTPFIWSQPDRFKLVNLRAQPQETMPDLRVTLDTWEDYVMLRAVFDLMGNKNFHAADLVQLAHKHPWLKEINAGVRHKLLPVREAPAVRAYRELSEAAQWACEQELYRAAHVLLQELDRAERFPAWEPVDPEKVKAECQKLRTGRSS